MNREELKKYAGLIDAYVKPNIFTCCCPANDTMKYPYVDPSAIYGAALWDFDSYWVVRVMFMAIERYKNDFGFAYEENKTKAVIHAKGSVLNFLDAQEENGYIPIMLIRDGAFHNYFHEAYSAGKRHNQHKPFLLQNIRQISEYCGDYDWFDIDKAVKYLEYYENNQLDEATGLFFWQDDMMIGCDTNPTVFFRKERSSADIFLNSFLALEYDALVVLLKERGDGRVETFSRKAQVLKERINAVMWDKKDRIYYSQDLSFYREPPIVNGFVLHAGMHPSWASLPLKIRFWGCFLPIYAGFCGKDRAREMSEKHFSDSAVMAKYGLRTIASDEPYYNLRKTSNPSNWSGAIWIVSNYCIYKGLKNFGIEIYKEFADKTISLLGENLEKTGEMYESYQPDDGEPCLYPHFFNWDLLVLEMLEDYGV